MKSRQTVEISKPLWPGLKLRATTTACSLPRTRSRGTGASVSLTTSRGSRRASRLEDSEIHVLTVDDVPGWMLMRKASMTQEWRELLTAALPSEHFGISDVKRFFEILKCTTTSTVNLMDNSRRPRNDNAGSSSACQRREDTSYPRRYRSALATVTSGDTESVDDETERILRTSKFLREVN